MSDKSARKYSTKRRFSEILVDKDVDMLTELVSNFEKFMEKTKSEARLMALKFEKLKVLTAVRKSHSILEEMKLFIAKSELALEVEINRCNKILKRENHDLEDEGITHTQKDKPFHRSRFTQNSTNLGSTLIKFSDTFDQAEDEIVEKCLYEMQQDFLKLKRRLVSPALDEYVITNPAHSQSETNTIEKTKNESTQTDKCCCSVTKVNKSTYTTMNIVVERSSSSTMKSNNHILDKKKEKIGTDLTRKSNGCESSNKSANTSRNIKITSSSNTAKNSNISDVHNDTTLKLDDNNNNSDVTSNDKSVSKNHLVKSKAIDPERFKNLLSANKFTSFHKSSCDTYFKTHDTNNKFNNKFAKIESSVDSAKLKSTTKKYTGSKSSKCSDLKSSEDINLFNQLKPISSTYKFDTTNNILKESNAMFTFGSSNTKSSSNCQPVHHPKLLYMPPGENKNIINETLIISIHDRNALTGKSDGSNTLNGINLLPKNQILYLQNKNKAQEKVRQQDENAKPYKKIHTPMDLTHFRKISGENMAQSNVQ